MNKYLRRGIVGTVLGLALCLLGLFLMGKGLAIYKWTMICGVIAFGMGFLTIIYGLIRKIERRSILDERKARNRKKR